MKRVWLAVPMFSLLVAALPAWGASDPRLERLTLCRDSWLEWKNTDPSALDSFGAFLRSNFKHNDNEAFITPTSAMIVDGLKVVQVFPGSLGMGLGFSVVVDASFDVTRLAMERDLGKPLRECEAGEGMRTCELSIAEQRTVMIAANDPPNDKTTLIGCYYYYEK
ncbi:hypothetical protein [Novosphingobium sp. Gsoil 351]|uniref:hypothetical protein n=1 Tax=Novosphingobium sp. Gsoil 351 TaxID=2675225 RepID=UPI0012B4ADB3|nr:hypothetical protein [Novosphingobium sp. Gsoil 351]QGN55667.1 hypothetical protein GKE62_15070 [Novosphingobium sp. Gsoil 351]